MAVTMEPGDLMRAVHGTLLSRPMNVSFVDEFVCGSARPFTKDSIAWLKQEKGVSSILSLTEKPLTAAKVEGMRYKHVSIGNHLVPSLPQLKECVEFLLSEVDQGRKVMVHCAAGKGRTGTVLAAYLGAKYDLTAEEAMKKVRAQRPDSIEKHQEVAVRQFFISQLASKKHLGP